MLDVASGNDPSHGNCDCVRLSFLAEERKLSGLTLDVTLGAERRSNAEATKRKNRSRAARAAPLQTATSSAVFLSGRAQALRPHV